MIRNLDGVFFRIQRDGEWLNLCFSDLTDEEMEMITRERDPEWLRTLAIHLGKVIRKIEDDLDLGIHFAEEEE